MNRGLVIKRAQYARSPQSPKRNRRIRTSEGLLGLIEYLDQEDHPNHQGLSLRGLHYWRTDAAHFADDLIKQKAAYMAAASGRRGRAWAGDIAEHLIVAPPKGAYLTEDEEERIAASILTRISPNSPACYEWHSNLETGRSELHIVAGSFTLAFPPSLRVTELRRFFGADYLLLLFEAGLTALNDLNLHRSRQARPPVMSLGDIRTSRKAALVNDLSNVAASAGILSPTIQDLLNLVGRTSWRVPKQSKASGSFSRDVDSTPLHIRWEELLWAIRQALAGIEKEREDDKKRQQALTATGRKSPYSTFGIGQAQHEEPHSMRFNP